MLKNSSELIKKVIQRKTTFWTYQIFGWIGFFVFGVSREILQTLQRKGSFDNLPNNLLSFVNYCIVGFVLTLVLRYVYQILYNRQYSITKTSGFIVAITVVITSIHSVLSHYIYILLIDPKASYTLFYYIVITFWNLQVFFGWSILYFGIKYWYQWNFEKDRAEKANLLAQNAQLQMLRYQLNPHFLFNSLNSIKALVNEDQKASRAMISELSEFLRYSLVTKNYSEVPLSNELEAIQHYFSIEKKRFEDKLEVAFEIDADAEKFPVLSFILHPLVENAVKYGMMTTTLPLQIIISAKIKNGNLTLQVKNSGKWIDNSAANNLTGTGTGLTNIRARLDNAYPNRYNLNIEQVDTCVVATIEIKKQV